jgi:hypothetical protein
MKKILFAIILDFTFMTMPGNSVCAQNSKKNIEPNVENNFMRSVYNLATLWNIDLTGTYILNRNEINVLAIRDFLERYNNINSAIWFPSPKGGFEAYFVQDGYGERVIYDKNGGWQMSLLVYNEEKLPRDIRSEVKRTYYDWDITLIEEVQNNDGVEYIINLEDKSKIRVLKVTEEGLMEELQDLDKQSN